MLETFGQLFLATILGALVGLERQISKKEAGMRTFSLVSLGSALFTIISVLAWEKFPSSAFNLAQIPSNIIVGAGFIGAGVIIFHKSHLVGLTTAAGLWTSAAVGMAVGFKFYTLAIFTAFLMLLVFLFFWLIEERVVDKIGNNRPPEK